MSSPKRRSPKRGTTNASRAKGRPPAKKTKAEKAQAAAHESMRRLDEVLTERRNKYRAFVETIRGLPGRERAEAWLAYVASDVREDEDEEASVYFLSRGRKPNAHVDAVIEAWKRAEEWTLRQAAEEPAIWTGKRFKRIKSTPKLQPSEILAANSADLPYFWFRDHRNEWYVDATMLRTVEWGEIGGFDDWWRKLARDEYEAVINGGTNPVEASYWIFAMSRSAYACELLRQSVIRHLEAVAFARHGKFPWMQLQFFESMPRVTAHLGYAAHLAFAATVIPNCGIETRLAESAAETLIKTQNDDGSWHQWEGVDRPSSFTTAAAIHALAVVDVRGGKRAMSKAARWLDSVQSPDGPWNGPEPIANPTFPTVLVLDAKNLSEGKEVTTATTLHTRRPTSSKASPARRYKVALSFSGQIRARVEELANSLGQSLGKPKVFYDKFHEGDLARPNLDLYLQRVYHDESELLVVFVSKGYEQAEWPQLEWRSIRDIIKARRSEEVVFVRYDDTDLPGLLSIDGYIDWRTHTDVEVVQLILHRLRTLITP